MNRFVMIFNLTIFIALLCTTKSAVSNLVNEQVIELDNTRDTINFSQGSKQYQTKMFSEFSLDTYYAGGEKSRFAWLNMPALFPHQAVHHFKTRPLKYALSNNIGQIEVGNKTKKSSFREYVEGEDRIDSILVLKGDTILFEHFKHHQPLQRHMSWSVTKVMISAVIAKLEQMGKLDVKKQLDFYLPKFANSVWSNATIADILHMASGVDCNDNAGLNANNCMTELDTAFGLFANTKESSESVDELFKNMRKNSDAGQIVQYSSANTIMLIMVIEAITGSSLSDVLSALIWQPMGSESDAMMLINKQGLAYGALSARLHDIARFGLIYVNKEASWLSLSKAHMNKLYTNDGPQFSEQYTQNLARLFANDAPSHSKWQWDLIWQDGDLYKDGFSGQGIYISPKNNLVVVWFGTADIQMRKHSLLPKVRQMSNALKQK